MFTGIITHIGLVREVIKDQKRDLLITVGLNHLSDPFLSTPSSLILGCSICCSGICLTLIEVRQEDNRLLLNFKASLETVNKTNIATWKTGKKINLEFALKTGDELGGHLVAGHVDGVALIKSIVKVEDSREFTFQAPANLMKFICPKGSVALEGVSLTVNEVGDDHKNKVGYFTVNIIEHSWNNTNFQYLEVGGLVNLEVDLIARYLSRFMEFKNE